jgi:membrane protein
VSSSAGVVGLVRDVAGSSRGHDLALYAAAVTFYASIAVVPLLLLTVYLAAVLVGEDVVHPMARELAGLLPSNLGAMDAANALAAAGISLGIGPALASFVPASLYGEGLVRAFDRLSVRGERGRRTLRGRLGSLVIVALSPLLLLAGLGGTNVLTRSLGDSGWARLGGIYGAFLIGWLIISTLLVVAYRGLSPERPSARSLAWGAFGTGSVLSGFCLGYVLFLSIEVPFASAFGGSVPVAAAAVSALWLYGLHVLVLVGYVATLRLHARNGHPRGPVVGRDLVRSAAVEPEVSPSPAEGAGAAV